jgi:hypothetical protein
VDEVEKLIDGCGGRKVANVDGASGPIVRGREGCGKCCT